MPLGALLAAIGSAQVPTSAPFRVDDAPSFAARAPAVAAAGAGFQVVWTSLGQDGDGEGIFSRRVESDAELGGEFQVAQYSSGAQRTPDVAARGDGGFVVVWAGEGAGDPDGVFGRVFDASGAPASGDFLVNEVTTNGQARPRVDAAADGGFSVVWLSELLEGGLFEVLARRFDSAGSPTTGEVGIGLSSDDPIGLALAAAAVADRNVPGFVVSWNDGESVHMRPVSDAGTAGPVTTLTVGQHPFPDPTRSPQLAFDATGKAWFTWGRRETIENTSTQGRRFDGSKLLPEVDLVPVSAEIVDSGALSLAGDRGFAVTYTDYDPGSPTGETRNRVRVFDAAGAQLADVPASLFGGFPEVADLAHGAGGAGSPKDFLVVWRQDDAILARRYLDLIFADGFESGDTSSWSDSVP